MGFEDLRKQFLSQRLTELAASLQLKQERQKQDTIEIAKTKRLIRETKEKLKALK